MLEPGTWIQFTETGHVQQGQFFSLSRCETPYLKENEAMEVADAVITEAVKRQTISDVSVGGFLSGRIDSPLVTAKMKLASTAAIRAFTIGTGEEATDESTDAMRYALEIGVEHTVEHVKSDTALDLSIMSLMCVESPLGIIPCSQQ